ncbi:cytochrome P450 [Stachybotrys elegans]|uniref:Cytochrome P450 n=1 Tax=Stachybotrys elegans TaxID=80388 RepID=A0A8K0T3C8_9HYPO|nr:cytochrome P450 [Stachybotrys elegans]
MALVILATLIVYVSLRLLLYVTQDPKEPPAILTSLPFVSPIIGMIRDKDRFHRRLRDEHRLPIYTLRLPFQRMYIVNDTKLIAPLQKQWRHVSFAAIAADAGIAVGMSKEALDIMHKDLSSDAGFSISWPRFIMSAMGPGKDLDAINRAAINVISAKTSILHTKGPIALGEWSRQVMVDSTTEAVWGPHNPYHDAGVARAWKTFEAGFLILSVFPGLRFLFPKLIQARELVVSAMTDYINSGGHEVASGLVRKRYEHHKGFGLTDQDIARGELGNTFAVLGNTVPCSFWVIWHIFSDDEVLQAVREELLSLVHTKYDVNSIDLSSMHETCPTLMSTFQEVLRYRAVNPGPRVLLEDVYLENMLLKKGSMLMIPAPVQHSSVTAWGEDAGAFNYRRFMKPNQGGTKFNRVAFRAFGGGHQLCPGRHFATTEIMALAAIMALQFDVVPTSGWIEPTYNKSPLQAGFPIPDQDIQVELRLRDPSKTWNVTFTGGSRMGVVAEDVE